MAGRNGWRVYWLMPMPVDDGAPAMRRLGIGCPVGFGQVGLELQTSGAFVVRESGQLPVDGGFQVCQEFLFAHTLLHIRGSDNLLPFGRFCDVTDF